MRNEGSPSPRRVSVVTTNRHSTCGTEHGSRPGRLGLFLAASVALLTLVFSPLPAQDIESVLERSGYSRVEQTRLTDLFGVAREQGLPTDGLLSRLAEGLAKGISADRLLAALSSDVRNLNLARDLILGIEGAEPILELTSAWERAGNLLRAGWSYEQLSDLVVACAARPEAFRDASLLYIAVTEWGAEQRHALMLTEAAVRSTIDPDAFPQVAALLGRARDNRVSLDQAVEMIVSGLDDDRSLRQIQGLLGR